MEACWWREIIWWVLFEIFLNAEPNSRNAGDAGKEVLKLECWSSGAVELEACEAGGAVKP
jgi:hypothetical protein